MNQPNSPLDALRIERKPAPEPNPWLGRSVVAALILVLLAAVIWWYFLPRAIEVQTAEARLVVRDGRDLQTEIERANDLLVFVVDDTAIAHPGAARSCFDEVASGVDPVL